MDSAVENKVTSVRRSGYVYVLPPVEVLSGTIKPLPEQEILRRVVDCSPGTSVVADEGTLSAFVKLPDNETLEVSVILHDKIAPGKASDILKSLPVSGSSARLSYIDLTSNAIGLNLDFPQFLKLCQCPSVKRISTFYETAARSA